MKKPSKLDQALAEIECLKKRVAELEKRRAPVAPKPCKWPYGPRDGEPWYPPAPPPWRDIDYPQPYPPRPYWLPDITCHAADQSQEIDGVAFYQTIRDSQ